MIESLLSGGQQGRTYFPESGPGNKYLRRGTEEIGYFGTVTDTELFAGWEIATFLNLNAGIADKISNNTWMKFIYKGKFLFVCKEFIRYSLSWNDIYNVGAMYGVKGPGLYPVSGSPADQWKIMLKQEAGVSVPWKLAVRTMKGANVDPYVGVDYTAFGLAEGNEYNDLMYRLLAVGTNSRPNTGIFEQWVGDTELAGGFAQYTILQETSVANVGVCMFRGPTGTTLGGNKATTRAAIDGYRPVLELITGDNVFSPYRVYSQYTGNMGPLSVTGEFVDVVQNPFQLRAEDPSTVKLPLVQSVSFVDVAMPPSKVTVVNPLYPVSMTFTRT